MTAVEFSRKMGVLVAYLNQAAMDGCLKRSKKAHLMKHYLNPIKHG
jgi:hypothetical protein